MTEDKRLIIKGLPVPPSIMLARLADNARLSKMFDRIEFSAWGSSGDMRADMQSGAVDLAVIPTNVAAAFHNNGLPIRLLSVSLWGILYVLTRHEHLASWDNLRGLKVAIPFKGNMPDTIFSFLAEKNGQAVDDEVILSYETTYVDAKNALLAGKVDAACLPEPVATAAEFEAKASNIGVRRLFDLQEEWAKTTGRGPRYAQAGPVVRAALVDGRPETGIAILEAIDDALAWMADDPSAAAEFGAPFMGGLSADVVAESLRRIELKSQRFPAARTELDFFYHALTDMNPGLLKGGFPDKSFYFIDS